MRRVWRPIVVSLLVVLPTLAADSTTPVLGIRPEPASLRAFRNARVVVSPDSTIDGATLVVRDGRVVAVGRDVRVPSGAEEIDVRGNTLYPGFIDPYSTYGLNSVTSADPPGPRARSAQFEGQRVGPDSWNDAIHAERSWVESFEADPEVAAKLLERGVTTVQSVRQDGILRGRGFVVSLGEGLPNDLVLVARGPHFASFDKGTSRQAYPSSLMGSIALLRQTFLDARWYAEAHAAWSRDPSRPRPEVNVALAALAGDVGPIVFESENEQSLLRAGRVATEHSLALIHVGSNTEYRRIDEVAALGRPILLPVVWPEPPDVARSEDEIEVTLADLRHWERAPANPAVLESRGVRFAFTGHGLAGDDDFLANIRRAIRRGLTPRAALAALTTVPADLCGVAKQVGTLEPGQRADFFIADGDVLTGEARVLGVWIGGRLTKEFVGLDQRDFRGVHVVTLETRRLSLGLRGKRIEDLSGKLRDGATTVDAQGLLVSRDHLTFHADLERLGLPGVYRFRLSATDGGLTATAVLPDGRVLDLAVERTPDAAEEDPQETRERERKERAEALDRETVSRLTVPSGAFGVSTPAVREDVLVRGATLWTGEAEGVLEGADLLVRDGRIAKIGRGLDAPRGARVIDATGKHVTSGLIDEHSHIAIARGVNEGSHAVTAEVRIGDVVDPDDVAIYRALAGGTTATHLLHGSANPIGGQCQAIKLRWGASAEGLKFAAVPPTIKLALGENVKQSNAREPTTRYPQTRMGVEALLRDSFGAAAELSRKRRAYTALSPDVRTRTVPPRRDLQLETLGEILEGRRFTHVHSYVQSEILMAMRLAEELGFRIQTFTHILEGYKVASEMAAHGASASAFSDWWAYKFEVYDAIPYNTCLLHDRGVVTSINSDSDDTVRRLNQEAAKSVLYCGMEPHEALLLATANPARQLRIDDRVGSLKPGKDADFVIWSGPPLSAYSKVEQTWVDGANYFHVDRDRELRDAATTEGRALVQKALRMMPAKRRGEGGPGRRQRTWHCDDVEDTWRE